MRGRGKGLWTPAPLTASAGWPRPPGSAGPLAHLYLNLPCAPAPRFTPSYDILLQTFPRSSGCLRLSCLGVSFLGPCQAARAAGAKWPSPVRPYLLLPPWVSALLLHTLTLEVCCNLKHKDRAVLATVPRHSGYTLKEPFASQSLFAILCTCPA